MSSATVQKLSDDLVQRICESLPYHIDLFCQVDRTLNTTFRDRAQQRRENVKANTHLNFGNVIHHMDLINNYSSAGDWSVLLHMQGQLPKRSLILDYDTAILRADSEWEESRLTDWTCCGWAHLGIVDRSLAATIPRTRRGGSDGTLGYVWIYDNSKEFEWILHKGCSCCQNSRTSEILHTIYGLR